MAAPSSVCHSSCGGGGRLLVRSAGLGLHDFLVWLIVAYVPFLSLLPGHPGRVRRGRGDEPRGKRRDQPHALEVAAVVAVVIRTAGRLRAILGSLRSITTGIAMRPDFFVSLAGSGSDRVVRCRAGSCAQEPLVYSVGRPVGPIFCR